MIFKMWKFIWSGFKLSVCFLLFLFASTGLPVRVAADTYYVSTNGSNSYNGLSPSYRGGNNGPFRTISRAADEVGAGDSVEIRGGTYFEKVTVSANGTVSDRILITNYNGEIPVIDGGYALPRGSVYDFLVNIAGDFVTISDLTIRRSAGGMLAISGDYRQAVRIRGEGSRETGIVAGGVGNLLDGCSMTDNGNGYGVAGQTTWGSAICTVSAETTIQNCLAYDNRGEGINAYSNSSRALIQDNISYNNRSVNLYLDSTRGAVVRRNIIYASPGWDLSRARGITIGAETGTATALNIVNNLMIGNFVNLEIDGNVTSLADSVVAHNTFVNARGCPSEGYNMGVYLRKVAFKNVVFKNNIVVEEGSDHTPIWVPESHPGLTLSHNCWNKRPRSAARGVGDITGDPLLAKKGSSEAGRLTPGWFGIMEGSCALDRAESIVDVKDDFFVNPRNCAPDMGAMELLYEEQALTPVAAGSPLLGQVPLTVRFTGSADGGVGTHSYHWTFGDGCYSASRSPFHVYLSEGTYPATLTVTDRNFSAGSVTVSITVKKAR